MATKVRSVLINAEAQRQHREELRERAVTWKQEISCEESNDRCFPLTAAGLKVLINYLRCRLVSVTRLLNICEG